MKNESDIVEAQEIIEDPVEIERGVHYETEDQMRLWVKEKIEKTESIIASKYQNGIIGEMQRISD